MRCSTWRWLPCTPLQVGITLQDALPGSPLQPVLILEHKKGGGEGKELVWSSYETGAVVAPLEADKLETLAASHSLAVTGKVLSAALEAFPTLSKRLEHIKVCMLEILGNPGSVRWLGT